MENDEEPWQYTLYIPHDARAVAICRRTLRHILTEHRLSGLADLAELLASELIGNSVTHTKGPAALRVLWDRGVLRIGAWDTDPTPPDPQIPTADEEHGRGLGLVRICADRWGWFPLATSLLGPTGKYVWCELTAS